MKVVVTGGAGFIGSHLTKHLLDKDIEVLVIDNLSRGFEELVDKRAEFENIDLSHQKKIETVLNKWKADAVIHLANYIVVPESVEKAVEYTENNVVNTVKLLEAMKDAQVRTIVFSSSATVYGEPKHLPLKEESPLGIQTNQYGASKIAMESFVAAYHKLYDMNAITLRYFNPYGPNERHEPETHAIPNFILSTLKKQPIPVYWQGEQKRDFIYVEDLAAAHTSVLHLPGYNIFNIGTENGIKIKDVIKKIFKIVGYEVPLQDLGNRPGDASATYASAKKLRQSVGWRPQTDLETGLSRTIDFYRDFLKI